MVAANTEKMKTVDKEFVKFFDVNGYQGGIEVLNAEEVQDLKKNFNAFEEKIGKYD